LVGGTIGNISNGGAGERQVRVELTTGHHPATSSSVSTYREAVWLAKALDLGYFFRFNVPDKP